MPRPNPNLILLTRLHLTGEILASETAYATAGFTDHRPLSLSGNA